LAFHPDLRFDAPSGSRDLPIRTEDDEGKLQMMFDGGFTFTNFLMDVLAIFVFAIWLWLFIVVVGDLFFRRPHTSGWVKALWVIFMIVVPYIGVLAYLIFEGRGMADRNIQQAREARDELRREVGFSVADEIDKLERLKTAGTITNDEFRRLRARLV
jgi:hypothetical protein